MKRQGLLNRRSVRIYRIIRHINAANVARVLSLVLFLAMLISIGGCREAFQYSPHEVRLTEDESNLNQKNIEKISQLNSDTIRIALFGDTQRSYDQLKAFVDEVNEETNIDFVLLAGDVTDFGAIEEFRWVLDQLKRLEVPFVAVPGNHDLLAEGEAVFKKMFGPLNFSFDCAGNRFIGLNTNSIESEFDGSVPDLGFLASALADTMNFNSAFVVSHIPPFDLDFDQDLVPGYRELASLNRKVRMSLHGHQHRYSLSEAYNDGVDYLVSSCIRKRSYALLTVSSEFIVAEEKLF